MPKINWEEFSEIKHQLSQERTIISGEILRLKKFDERLEIFEDKLIALIEKHGDEDE